jgi:hypothetical protein
MIPMLEKAYIDKRFKLYHKSGIVKGDISPVIFVRSAHLFLSFLAVGQWGRYDSSHFS